MPSPSDAELPRCLLCSMHCPIGAGEDRFGHVSTAYPPDLGVEDQGACVRGLTAGRLLDAPERVFTARKGEEAIPLGEAFQALAGAVAEAESSRAAVLVDLSRPLEGVLAVAALCRKAGARLAAFAPPEDLALVEAGVLNGRPAPPLGDLKGRDCVLAVGDPLSSHPAVARPLRDMQFAARGNRLLSVDVGPGRTGRSADESIIVAPGKLAGFLCSVAIECGATEVQEALGGAGVEEICGELDLPLDRVRSLASELEDASAPGVVLSHSLGRYPAGAAVAAASGALASAVGAGCWPLVTSTNSAALPYLRDEFDALGVGELLAAADQGEISVLVVAGPDLASALPEDLWRGLADACDLVCWAASLETPFAEVADLVVPLSLPWSEGGTVLGPSGEAVKTVPWLPEPPTTLTLTQFAQRAAAAGGVGELHPAETADLVGSVARGTDLTQPIGPQVLEAAEPGEGQAVLVGVPEPQGYTGGLPLRVSSWQQALQSEEVGSVTDQVAEDVGLAEDGCLALSNGSGFTVPVRRMAGEGRMVGLPAHWEALRELLQWRGTDGALRPAPTLVNVESCD